MTVQASCFLCFLGGGGEVLSLSEIFVYSPFWVRSRHIYMVEEKKMALSVYIKPFIYKHGIPELKKNMNYRKNFQTDQLNLVQLHSGFPSLNFKIFFKNILYSRQKHYLYYIMFSRDPQWTIFKVFLIYFVFRSDKNTRVIVRHNGGAIVPSLELNRQKWMFVVERIAEEIEDNTTTEKLVKLFLDNSFNTSVISALEGVYIHI